MVIQVTKIQDYVYYYVQCVLLPFLALMLDIYVKIFFGLLFSWFFGIFVNKGIKVTFGRYFYAAKFILFDIR